MSPAGTRFGAGLGMNWSTDDWRKARADRTPRRARARAWYIIGYMIYSIEDRKSM